MRKVSEYKNPNSIVKTWWVIKYAIELWIEWQNAKRFTKTVHPDWVNIVTYTRNPKVKEIYHKKILEAYRNR